MILWGTVYNYETVLIGEDCRFVENVSVSLLVCQAPLRLEVNKHGLAHAYVYEWYDENGDVDVG